MSPFPSLGEISFTKFTSPEATVQKLSHIVPGESTASEVEAALADATTIPGHTPEPLWNDLIAYQPPLGTPRVPPGSQVVVDNELLRAARAGRPDRHLLLWVALNLADPRLDDIVRGVLTDADGHLKPSAINTDRLEATLDRRDASSSNDLPRGRKAATNILSLLERCELIVPEKRGNTIVGVHRPLPTRHAVVGAVTLVAERLSDRLAGSGFGALPGRELDLALSLGVNAWLNLSPSEFRAAYEHPLTEPQDQSDRSEVPEELVELAAQLRRKGQVVLQGPPGAGKTYVAKRYVQWVTADRAEDSRLQAIIDDLPSNERTVAGIAGEVKRRGLVGLWDIVQFHPGYDYTDFVRALVAQPHGDGVTFVPQHRILSLISAVGAELARHDYDLELVLVLDEINRGDIPNIFGELLYALEYRGEAVATPYSVGGDASLTIPENLRVLGTMNTADRSIAVIDYALRRRFVFLDIAATTDPIHAYAFDDESTRQASLYLHQVTTEALADAPSGLQVGPSYFLATADDADSSLSVLAARYVYEVLPLLTEYEMEGEVDPAVLAGLRQRIGLSDGSPQRHHAAQLVEHMSTQPWEADATTDTAPPPSTTELPGTTATPEPHTSPAAPLGTEDASPGDDGAP